MATRIQQVTSRIDGARAEYAARKAQQPARRAKHAAHEQEVLAEVSDEMNDFAALLAECGVKRYIVGQVIALAAATGCATVVAKVGAALSIATATPDAWSMGISFSASPMAITCDIGTP